MKQGGVPAAKATATLPKLKRDATGLTSNIVEWRMNLAKVLDPSFGELLNTIATGDSWQHPELTEEDIATINPPVVGVVWDAEDRKKAIVHLTMEKRKKEKRYEALQPAMWAAIMSNVSDDSTRIVEQHADWDDSVTTFDIGALITMLVDTHRGQLDTAGAPNIRTKVRAKDDFNSVQQGATETLQQYNQRFIIAKKKCDSVAVTDIPTGVELVYQWLKGLDQRRHGTMLAQLLNNPTSFPTTLTEAMATAETWTTPVRNKQGEVLCIASDLVLYSSPAQPKPHSGSSKTSGSSKKQPSGQAKASTDRRSQPTSCFNCGGQHKLSACTAKASTPHIAAKFKEYKQRRESDKATQSQPRAAQQVLAVSAPTDSTPSPAATAATGATTDELDEDDYYMYVDAEGQPAYDFVGVITTTLVPSEKGNVRDTTVSFDNPNSMETKGGLAQGARVVAQLAYASFTTTPYDPDTVVGYTAGSTAFDSAAAFSVMNPASRYVADVYPIQTRRATGIGGATLPLTTKASFMGELDVFTSNRVPISVLSQSELKDQGGHVHYDDDRDQYRVTTPAGTTMLFTRQRMPNGELSRHYLLQHNTVSPAADDDFCAVTVTEKGHVKDTSVSFDTLNSMDHDLCAVTVTDLVAARTKLEVNQAARARRLHNIIGGATPAAGKTVETYADCDVTARDLQLADAIFGHRRAHAMGSTTTPKPVQAVNNITAASTSKEPQLLELDIFTFDHEDFLVGVLNPSKYALTQHLRRGTGGIVTQQLDRIMSECRRHKVSVVTVRSDNAKALHNDAIDAVLNKYDSTMDEITPDQHCAEVERLGRTLKDDYRGRRATAAYAFGIALITLIVQATVMMYNCRVSMQTIGAVTDRVSTNTTQRVDMGAPGTILGRPPATYFFGRNVNARLDLPAAPGDFCYVNDLQPTNSNSTEVPRVREGIYGHPTMTTDHGHRVLLLDTMQVVSRAAASIKPQPTPQHIVELLNDLADEDSKKQQTTLNLKPVEAGLGVKASCEKGVQGSGVQGSGVQPADGKQLELSPPARRGRTGGTDSLTKLSSTGAALRRANGPLDVNSYVAYSNREDDIRAKELLQILRPMSQWTDADFVLKIAVKKAMKTREVEATAAITKELKQMIDMRVWRPVRMASLPLAERYNFIRSQCFLKDKYTAAGIFEKLKARLVARGDMQDKTLYDNLASPTVATTSALITAAIAASEGRHVMSLDVPGAFLNADMEATGVTVRMLLDPVMTAILVKIDPTYAPFVNPNGTCLVELDKALYGTVEAAKLWYDMLTGVLVAEGFVANPYDACVFNKTGKTAHQVTICLHVDDLLVTCRDDSELDAVQRFLGSRFGDVTVHRGSVINYVGMTFDFAARPGQCEVTMNHMTDEIIKGSGVTAVRATPATAELFNTREDAPPTTAEDQAYFRTYVAKLLYLAKRVRPECLTAVGFLTTRTQACDGDDLAKLRRVIAYLASCPHRGICLSVGEDGPNVKSYIDAAYGVHSASGKSHTGSVIMIGNRGPVYVSSSKQKIVTKSSTEAELVGLSDAATQAVHTRHFVEAQGYATAPLTIYQDNMSCMALIKRGGPCSQRSRHISIRRFWLKERVDGGEVVIRHMATEEMVANILTKPVQGMQFLKERQGLTNWDR